MVAAESCHVTLGRLSIFGLALPRFIRRCPDRKFRQDTQCPICRLLARCMHRVRVACQYVKGNASDV